jgi:hypothetical protein
VDQTATRHSNRTGFPSLTLSKPKCLVLILAPAPTHRPAPGTPAAPGWAGSRPAARRAHKSPARAGGQPSPAGSPSRTCMAGPVGQNMARHGDRTGCAGRVELMGSLHALHPLAVQVAERRPAREARRRRRLRHPPRHSDYWCSRTTRGHCIHEQPHGESGCCSSNSCMTDRLRRCRAAWLEGE